jgi:GntR family transcriptional regulator/MocR family aminotransferase
MSPVSRLPQELVLRPPPKGVSLQRWLYSEIRDSIASGRLRPGSRLPSTRRLASEWKIARGTVVSAYEQLRSEGFLELASGSGTFVSHRPEPGFGQISKRPRTSREPAPAVSPLIRSRKGGRSPFPKEDVQPRAFRPFQPDCDHFPVAVWARLHSRVARRSGSRLLKFANPFGYRPLREVIASYLGFARGVRTSPDNILVTSGGQHALDLVVRLCVKPGDEVVLEDPVYPGVRALVEAAGAVIQAIPVDGDGLRVEDVVRLKPRPRLVYVTPAHQCPLGSSLSLDRRLALIHWAQKTGSLVFEDDYDGEYRYSGRPLPALQGLDDHGCVIYAGTFNKVLFPALRLGYAVLPEGLIDPMADLRSMTDRFSPSLQEATLAEFISAGHFASHIRRMREIYAARLDALRKGARESGGLEIDPAMNGLETIGWLEDSMVDTRIAAKLGQAGIESRALSTFTIHRKLRPGLILGFGAVPEPDIKKAMRQVSGLLAAR